MPATRCRGEARAAAQGRASYQGTFTGARRYVLQTFATTQSAMMKRRVAQFMLSSDCPVCLGKRLRPEALSVKFAGLDIADISRLPLKRLSELLRPYLGDNNRPPRRHPEKAHRCPAHREDLLARLSVLLDLGLGYLTLERSTPTLSPGELQRLRLATQVRSNLFGVVYVLDEPSAGLHPADTEALLRALDRLKDAGNSLFVVEHELDVIRHADWIVDVGPGAGEKGGEILYSGPAPGLADVRNISHTTLSIQSQPQSCARAALAARLAQIARRHPQQPRPARRRYSPRRFYLRYRRIRLRQIQLDQPVFGRRCRRKAWSAPGRSLKTMAKHWMLPSRHCGGEIAGGLDSIKRLVVVDQKPIGRTPRSNLATYTGLFDHVRKLFAATKQAKRTAL